MSYSEPKSIDEFNTFISNADVTIVDFYTPWCGPCKKFAPAFSAYANNNTQESKLHFMKLQVDNEILHSIAQKYKITGLPTIIAINKDGTELKRMVGISETEFKILLNHTKTVVYATNKQDKNQEDEN